MKLTQLLQQKKYTLSFEVFPPKPGSDAAQIVEAVRRIAALQPDFISVTYGAGGGANALTGEIASQVQRMGVTALAHLTCVGAKTQAVEAQLAAWRAAGIENILALRGDLPEEGAPPSDYAYAKDLVRQLRASGGFCVGGACYPEGHVECQSKAQDLAYLKEKVESGCEFLTTQMFFDNSVLYSFLYRLLDNGIDVPVFAGVMPVTNGRQIARICRLSGTSLPSRFRMIVDQFGANPPAMKQAGVAYATEQIIDLIANGVRNIHVYTMNKPDIAAQIMRNLQDILR